MAGSCSVAWSSQLLQQVLAAFGFPARVVGLRRARSDEGLGKGHVVVDVWSNQYRKWIELDPQLNTAFEDASRRLLSPLEVHDLVCKGEHSRILMTREAEMRAAWEGIDAKDNTKIEDLCGPEAFSRAEIWDALPDHGDFDGFKRHWLDNHYHLAYRTRHGLHRPKATSHAVDDETLFYYEAGDMPAIAFQGMRQNAVYTQDRHRVDFPLNGLEVQWHMPEVPERAPLEATRQVTMHLSHAMPWFDHFVIAVGGKVTETDSDTFTVALDRGENAISVTPVNDMGRRGVSARVVFLLP